MTNCLLAWVLTAGLVGAALAADVPHVPKPPVPDAPPCAGPLVANPALPFGLTVWDDVPAPLQEQVRSYTELAIAALQKAAPSGDTLFHWQGSRDTVKQKKDVVYVLTTYPAVKSLPQVGQSIYPGSDAGTLMMGNHGDIRIYVFLFVDNIFYDFGGLLERPDGLARLFVAMAHETYGNVQHFLEMDATKVPGRPTELMRAEQEIRAFQAGLDFIDRLLAQFQATPPGGNLPRHLGWARVREESARDQWAKRANELRGKK
jgi:hypothetical protein